MKSVLAWWDRVERRYTYRIPTAVVCTALLVVGTAVWGMSSDDRKTGQREIVAGAPAPARSAAPTQGAPGQPATQAAGAPSTAAQGGQASAAPSGAAPSAPSGGSTSAGGYTAPSGGTASASGGAAPSGSGSSASGGTSGGTSGGGTSPSSGNTPSDQSTQAAPAEQVSSQPEENACPNGLDQGDCTGVTPDTIRIGTHSAQTRCGTPLPDTTDPNEAEASDWVKYVNDVEGGINGRKLDLYTADDGYCPEYAGRAAAQLIDENRVFSVQGFLGVDQNRVVAEKAQSRGVPYLAGGGPQEWAQKWTIFHQNQSSYDVMYPAVLKYIVGKNGLNMPDKKIGMMYVDTPDVRDPTLRSFQAVPEAKIVASLPITASGGIKQDFLNEITEFRSKGAEVIYCNCHPLNMVAFVQQADAQGYKPQYTFVSQGADLDLVLRLFPGDSTWAQNAKGLSNFCHQTHPCSAPYAEKIKKVKPGAVVSQVSLIGVHAIEMWAEPLRRMGPQVNRTKLMQQWADLNGWSTGLTGPIYLSPDRSTGAIGFAVYQSPGAGAHNYQMVDVNGSAYNQDWR